MSVLFVLLALAFGMPAPAETSVSAPSAEMRGLWVVRTALTSPEAVDRVVDEAARGGFNALFVQVRGRGDAFYRSDLVPRSELLRGQPASFDPLARLIPRARARGMAVHAWVNVLLVAGFGVTLPPDHVARRHPDWLMVPRSAAAAALHAPRDRLRALIESGRDEGDVEGLYLSPMAPGVRAHLEGVVDELVQRYPLDGLHFDFIRFPGRDYDHSRAALAGLRARTGRGWLLDGPLRDPEAWAKHRRDALDALVLALSRASRRGRPGIVLSAAVVPDEAQAIHEKAQDWPSWLARGLLDAACPMAYTPDTRAFRAQIAQLRARVGARPLWAGVGAYRLPVESVIEKVRAAREAGAAGVVLFSHESLGGMDLDALRAAVFPVAASGASVSADPAR